MTGMDWLDEVRAHLRWKNELLLVLHEKHRNKRTAPKVPKGRRLASGESAEGGSRKRSDNDRKALCSRPQARNLCLWKAIVYEREQYDTK